MRQLLRFGKRAVNAALSPFGVELQRVNRPVPDTSLYEEDHRPDPPRYLNIGAGDFYHPYWHNLDNPNDYYEEAQKGKLHIAYDLTSRQPIPLGDNSLKVAYTSHVVEHISNGDVEFLFREVHRCLQPDGFFRITCPDMDLEYAAFLRDDGAFWKWPNAYGVYNTSTGQKFLDHFATALTASHPVASCRKLTDEELDAIFESLPKQEAFDSIVSQLPAEIQKDYCGDHINWFNSEKLKAMLSRAGFSSVYDSRYGQSHCPILRDRSLFDSTCPELSLYVECQK